MQAILIHKVVDIKIYIIRHNSSVVVIHLSTGHYPLCEGIGWNGGFKDMDILLDG